MLSVCPAFAVSNRVPVAGLGMLLPLWMISDNYYCRFINVGKSRRLNSPGETR